MYQDDHNAPPIHPLPPVVVLTCLALAAVEMLIQAAETGFTGLLAITGLRVEAISTLGFYDTIVVWMFDTGKYPPEFLVRFLTYAFVHGSFVHAVFAIVLILAIGKMVAEVFSQLAFVVIFIVSTLAGAGAYALFLDTQAPLFGAYPAAYGMIGAMTFMLWVRAKVEGTNRFRAFSMILLLMGIQLFFKLVFGGSNDWVADIAGFTAGFALSFVLAPDGPERVTGWLNNLRRRR